MRTITKDDRWCNLCGKYFQGDENLRLHYKSTHIFQCSRCKKIAIGEGDTSKHRCVDQQFDSHIWDVFTHGVENVMPLGQGKRDARRARHDLIPIEFLDELASIFEEGLPKYGDSWKAGGKEFLIDCLNHASNHLHKYMNGDESENQLAKVAWNCLAVRWHKLYESTTTKPD